MRLIKAECKNFLSSLSPSICRGMTELSHRRVCIFLQLHESTCRFFTPHLLCGAAYFEKTNYTKFIIFSSLPENVIRPTSHMISAYCVK